jgi:RHS repeat-associated protein
VVNENGPDGNISYAYGPSLISASATGLQSFYQFDGLGSVTTVTDQSASQTAGYAYDSWGVQTQALGTLGTKNKYRYTGEALDPETGLVFLRARYYDPSTGRFLGKDPAAGPLSLTNAYLYALGNPARFVDPNGQEGFDFLSNLFHFASSAKALGQQREDDINCVDDNSSCDIDGNASQRATLHAAQDAAGVAVTGGEWAYSLGTPAPDLTPGSVPSMVYNGYTSAMTIQDIKQGVQALQASPGTDNPYLTGTQGPSLPSGGEVTSWSSAYQRQYGGKAGQGARCSGH